jgi:hypothetical protein
MYYVSAILIDLKHGNMVLECPAIIRVDPCGHYNEIWRKFNTEKEAVVFAQKVNKNGKWF